MKLLLPEPPSKNKLRSAAYSGGEGYARHLRHTYKRAVWAEALGQKLPTTDPPSPVLVSAHFRLHGLRDEDNLYASLDLICDALRCPREGETMDWRQGIAVRKGFFVDDNPRDMTLGEITQEIDRADRGVTVTIADLGS